MEEQNVEAGEAGEAGLVRIGKRVYVGNLAWRTSWQDLKDHFRGCGTVVYANVMMDDNRRSKGWGIVEYETPEEALVAINSQNGTDLGGRNILVREDREDRDVKPGSTAEPGAEPAPRAPRPARGAGRGSARTPAPGRGAGGGRGRGRGPPEREGETSGLQVVVQGLPWAYTWAELKDMFNDIAGLDRADVQMGNDGRSRGFGTVKFLNPEGAQAAIQKWHGQDLEGRTCSVFLDKFA